MVSLQSFALTRNAQRATTPLCRIAKDSPPRRTHFAVLYLEKPDEGEETEQVSRRARYLRRSCSARGTAAVGASRFRCARFLAEACSPGDAGDYYSGRKTTRGRAGFIGRL